MTSKVFVTGATGTTGFATVEALRAKGIEVVAGVHSLEKVGPLRELGATIQHISFSDVAGMSAAMRGAEALYLVTPVTQDKARLTAAIIEAARNAEIWHVAKLSGLDVDIEPGFTLGHWHHAAEKIIEASGLNWTFLRPNAFMQNFLGNAHGIKAQGAFSNPFGAAPISFIDARDIGAVAAEVLTTGGHEGKRYDLTGPRALTSADVTRMLSSVAGKTLHYTHDSLETTQAMLTGYGMPAVEANAVTELLGYLATGQAAEVSPDVERILGRPARDFVQFAQDFGAAFR